MQSRALNHIIQTKTQSGIFFGLFILFTFLTVFSSQTSADIVNINKANAETLQQNMEGIGPVKADAIIQYRKKNGPFKSTDDLSKVPGIGSEILKKNRKNVSTSRGLVKADIKKQQAKARKDNAKSNSKKKTSGKMDKKLSSKSKADKKMKKDKKPKMSASSKDRKKEELVKKSKQSKTDKKAKKVKKTKLSKKSLKDNKPKKSK